MSIKYKPILPSSLLQTISNSQFSYVDKTYNNSKLRIGVVLELIPKEDKRNNRHGLGPEYNVLTIEQHGSRGITTSDYLNCIALDTFGGVADFMEYTRRTPEDQEKVHNKGTLKNQVGSIVMILCQDGISDKGIIIGSIAHPDRPSKLTKEAGHHLEGEFNGLNWVVDKDGAFTLTFKSATDAKGVPINTKVGTSHIQIDKDGSIEFNTNLTEKDETKIIVDKVKKQVTIKAGSDITLDTQEHIQIKSVKDINADIKSLLVKASGEASIEAASSFKLKSDGSMIIDASSLDIKSSGSGIIKAQQLTLDAPMINVGKGGTPAITLSTQVLTIGNLGIPAVGTMIGPFSSSVFIGS